MFGVPSHYQQLAVDPKLQNKDLSFIRNYAAGGDAIARGAEQTVNDFLAAHNVEFPIAKGYGMTEASSAATAAAGQNNKPGSVGLPLVNTLVSAFEPGTDTELPIGQRGELCISGSGCIPVTSAIWTRTALSIWTAGSSGSSSVTMASRCSPP